MSISFFIDLRRFTATSLKIIATANFFTLLHREILSVADLHHPRQ